MRIKTSPLRVLDFDCEARPLGWYAGDETHKEITAIAWKWIGDDSDVEVASLTKDDRTRGRMLRRFQRAYDDADMVVGHYIRGFDLPLVNAMLLEAGEAPLARKLTHDTMLDLVRLHGVSKSQENLSAMFGVEAPKVHMTVPAWREANRLTREGVDKGIERCAFDVVQNIELRRVLLAQGMLGPPRVWRP